MKKINVHKVHSGRNMEYFRKWSRISKKLHELHTSYPILSNQNMCQLYNVKSLFCKIHKNELETTFSKSKKWYKTCIIKKYMFFTKEK